jgi:hypothetical protein
MPRVEGDAPVTDRPAADDRLRDAFQALGETSQVEVSPEDVDRVWRAVAGSLPAEERRELVDRMATEPGLAEAWRSAQELWRSAAETPPATPAIWTRSWLAAAAVLIIGVAIAVVFQRSPSRDDTFRQSGNYVIESLVQPETTLSRDAFRLRWTPGPQDARYQVTVTTEDLRVLTTASDLTLPELTLESGLLSDVAPGARVLWQVSATLPGGERAASQTFVVRVR